MRNILYALILFSTFQFTLSAQDLEFEWAKKWGSTSEDWGYSLGTDSQGNIYSTGMFSGTVDFDPGPDTFYLTSLGEGDIFVSKLHSDGTFAWAKQFGGNGGYVDLGISIYVDSIGNSFSTGFFYNTADFDPGPDTFNLSAVGDFDIYILKLDNNGEFLWATQFKGVNDEDDLSYSISCDNDGNVFTTGSFGGIVDFDPGPDSFNLVSLGARDIFICKLSNSGSFIWAKQMGGGLGYALSIVLDNSGNIYTTGGFSEGLDFDPGIGNYTLSSQGFGDIFISKLDNMGNFIFAQQYGSSFDDAGRAISIDNNDNILVTGSFFGTIDFNSGPDTNFLTAEGESDIFILKIDSLGNYLWAKNQGGLSYDHGTSISSDNYCNVFTTGNFSASADFDPSQDTFILVAQGGKDPFISKLNSSGDFIWAGQVMGPGGGLDNGRSIKVSYDNQILVLGEFKLTADFDPGPDTFFLTSASYYGDVFVLKLSCFPSPFQMSFTSPQYAIQQNGNQAIIAEPIQLGTGTYSYSHEDFKMSSIGGPLKFLRSYNSLNSNLPGSMGYGWSHTYDYFLINRQDTAWDIHYPDGHLATFIPMNSSGQSFPIFSGTTDSLQKHSNNRYSLFTKEKMVYRFDSIGKLDSIIDLNGNITRLFYTGSKLDSVLAPGGRSLIMTYNSNKLATVMDPLDRICSYSYDADSNLIRVVGANMDTTSFTYDSLHRILSIINPLGDTIVANVYDSTGRVISQEDAFNSVTSIAYDFPATGDATVTHPDSSQLVVHHDVFFRKTSEIDELNFTKSYTYDINSNETGFTNENNHAETRLFDQIGNLLSDTLPGDQITNITYNNFNSPVQITDANGYIKLFYRDSVNNNLDSIINPDGSLLIFTYDSLGLVTQSIDGNGNITSYLYSTAGDLLSIQTATGIKQFTYDAAGRRISSTDENGHTTTYMYDNNDNLLLTTDALGRTIQNTYDANNQLLSSVDKNGYETTYSYDGKGRKTSTTDPKGGVTTYTYDVRDRLVSVTDPESNTMFYTYDAKGRKISSTNALGTTQYQYDAVGNLVKVIDPTNKITDYTYTATNKKQSQSDGLNNTTSFAYDLNDNLISVIDPLSRTTGYGYDSKNRLISVTDAANNTTSISYDFNDNKVAVTDPMGHTQTYNYDAANRLMSYEDAAGNTYNYSYDSVGNNLILTKPTGTITKVYDAANRVITTNNSTGNNYSYSYDNNDNVITMSNTVGTSTLTYDSLNQLIQYLDPHGNLVSLNYDSTGNKTSVIYPGNKIVSYTYDGANNLTSVTDWLNQTFTYAYDSSGRTSQLTYPNGITCQYGYDNAGRLDKKIIRLDTGLIISGSTFTLDAVGNRVSELKLAQVPAMLPSISRAYSYANDDSMVSDSVWNFTNDNSGNRTAETDGIYTATYNFTVDNLLNSRIDTSGINYGYAYNPLGQRISKTIGSDVNEYVLDISSSLSQVLQITDSNGVVQSSYVYGHGLLERIDTADNSLFYHFDAQHNTVLLSDQDTIITDTYTYDPFGAILSHIGPTTQPFTFLGEYGVEMESPSLYFVRARYYDAANGRFISKDAYDYDLNNPQTINRYVYSVNNPISIFDYTGLFGEQDNGVDNNYDHFLPSFSYQLNLVGLNKYNDLWNRNTDTWWYPYIKPLVPTLGKIEKLSSAISIKNYIDDYKRKEVGLPETSLRIAMEFYSDGAKYLGGAVAGPFGAYSAEVVADFSKRIGERFVRNTGLGNSLTDYLAAKYFMY